MGDSSGPLTGKAAMRLSGCIVRRRGESVRPDGVAKLRCKKAENRMNQPGPFAELKTRQREMWASFTPTAIFTTPVAGQLVKFAGVGPDQDVLDVGTGTGVVAITAARAGARVT